jgi:hypothetical protein
MRRNCENGSGEPLPLVIDRNPFGGRGVFPHLMRSVTNGRRQKMNATKTNAIDGTSLQGEISTTKAQLIATFGAPNWDNGDESQKVTIEWAMVFEDGTLATIYDWKRYEDGAPELYDEIVYNIGGMTVEAAVRVKEVLETPKAKIKRSLFIEGREWFDKVNGNSYFTARIWVDGGQVAILPFQYGYGEQYIFTAFQTIKEEFKIKSSSVLSVFCKNTKSTVIFAFANKLSGKR